MQKLLCALLLASLTGCASIVLTGPDLPEPLVGQWVADGFLPAPKEDTEYAEPYRGNAVYLLKNGRAGIWATEIGVPCTAKYTEASHTLILTEVQVDPGPFAPTTARFVHDPKAKTLTLVATRAPGQPEDHHTEIYKWRKAGLPVFVRRAWSGP